MGVEPSVLLGEALTPRELELEVLELMKLGRTNRQIAEDLVISSGTVKKHVEHIITKLGVSDRTQAVIKALELGISEFGPQGVHFAHTQAPGERRKSEAEWEAEGGWAEHYVSGNSAQVRGRDEELYLRYALMLPSKARQVERNVAWAKLYSRDLKETVEVVQETPRVIYEVLEDLRNKQASFESIPHLYFEDPDAQHRIEKLRVALQQYRQEAGEAVQGLLELQREALHRLDAALNEMRKEGDVLEILVHRVGI